MVRWKTWHCPPDTGFKIRARAIWGRASHLSVTEASHNIGYLRVSGEETLCFFETWRPEWGSNPRSPTFQAGSFNQCTRSPAHIAMNYDQSYFDGGIESGILHCGHTTWPPPPPGAPQTPTPRLISRANVTLWPHGVPMVTIFQCGRHTVRESSWGHWQTVGCGLAAWMYDNVPIKSYCYYRLHLLPTRDWKLLPNINPFSALTVFRRQTLTSLDVRLWRLRTIPALEELNKL